MGTENHKKNAPVKLKIGIITVSSTRTLENDKSGAWMKKSSEKEGHTVVFHGVILDDASIITKNVLDVMQNEKPHAILITGGTGISSSDVTIEAVSPLFTKKLPGFGAVFAQLSYEQIDSAAILSRAAAGISGKVSIFCIPGSLKACKLACRALIFPELGHIAGHII